MLDPVATFEALMLILVFPGLLIPLFDKGRGKKSPMIGPLSVAILAVSLALALYMAVQLSQLPGPVYAFEATVRFDPYSAYLGALVTFGTLLVALASLPEVRSWPTAPSYFSLLLLALAGVLTMLYVADSAVLLSAWTVVAVASYVVVGLKKDVRSLEGAAKYGLMGATSSSLLIFGLAVLVGLTGSSALPIEFSLPRADVGLIMLGVLLLLAAFGFKLGMFPFHGWLPDVYGGVHPILVSYIAGVVKMAAIAGLLRMVLPLAPAVGPKWLLTLGLFSVLTMTFGNMVALVQRNVQRMMAYSSIAHAGYLLVGFAAVIDPLTRQVGLQGVALHLTTYVLAKVGIFVALAYMIRKGVGLTLSDLRGMGRRMPVLGIAFSTLLLSLMGMPPLIGFWSKFTYLFYSVVDTAPWLALIGVLNSGISVGYYAQIIRYLYFAGEAPEDAPREDLKDPALWVVTVTALLTLILGLGLAQPLAEFIGP
ncbi:MAG TPA: NADH-quinone oxidoreductase subunit N [Candidatus Korarchaeota archaeon]|nr:NADH-quinone oxidoreductase subunit N [Candidatus Korarchaeota archaeon]